jgi:hypothetical protein
LNNKQYVLSVFFVLNRLKNSDDILQSLDPKLAESRKYHHRRQRSSGSVKFNLDGPMKRVFDSIEVVPTREAEASR